GAEAQERTARQGQGQSCSTQHRNETHLQPRREGTIDSLTLTDPIGRRWQRTGQNGAAASAVSCAIAASRSFAVCSAYAADSAVAADSPLPVDSAAPAPSPDADCPPSADVSDRASQPEDCGESVSRAAWPAWFCAAWPAWFCAAWPAWFCARSGAFDRR